MTAGTVGICAQETGRYSAFAESLAVLQTPAGTTISWAYGDTVAGRNLLVNGMQGDWIWFMDDDHVFEPDLLLHLLAHEVDVVVPVCLMRQQPFFPVERVSMGESLDLKASPMTGLVEVHSAGTAGMLIRRNVLEAMRLGSTSTVPVQVFEKGPTSEDYLFCEKVRSLGFKIHCDLGAQLGHMTATAIWPGRTSEGEACVSFVISDSYLVQVGIADRES